MQNKQAKDRFNSRTIALWATIAALGSVAPAQAESSQKSAELAANSLPTEDSVLISDTEMLDITHGDSSVELAVVPADITAPNSETMVYGSAPVTPELIDAVTADVNGTQDSAEIVALSSPAITPTTEESFDIAAIDEALMAIAPTEDKEVIASNPEAVNAAAYVEQEIEANDIAVTPVEAEASEPKEEKIGTQLIAQADVSNEARVLVAEVLIQGVEDIQLQREVVNAIETQAGRPTTVSLIRADVNRIYATGLFANVTATPEDTDLGVRVTFDVEPNPVLTKVIVQPLPLDDNRGITTPEEIERIFGDRYGKTLNLNDFQEGSGKLGQLERWYQENGYDLAKVIGIDEPTPDGEVTLVVVEGVIEDIRVNFLNEDGEPLVDEEGNPTRGKTRDFIITRELQLKPGDVFRRDIAQNDLQRVFGLGLFEDVQLDFTTGEEDPTKAILNLNVIETNTGSIAAGGGISSASGFFGTVSYQQQNLGGNNHRLSTEVQLGTRETLFDVSFSDPWIANDPYRTSYTVNAFRRRSISLIFDGGDNDVDLAQSGDRPRINRLGGGISFGRPLSRNVFERSDWRASLGFQYQRITIADSDGDTEFIDEAGNQLSFSDDGKDDLFSLRFNLVRDKRDSQTAPTGGSITRIGTDQTIPLGSGNIFFNRIRGSHSFYVPSPFKIPTLAKEGEGKHTLAFNIQGGTIIGDLPPYEAFSLGGSNSVRGFEEGDVGSGRRYLQATAEYRFPFFSVVGGTLFADYATDLGSGDDVPGDPAGTRGKPGNGFGYGVGVRIDSPLGNIRVDYGLNDEGDSRIHFGIGERF